KRDQFLELAGFCRAKKKIGCLLIRLKKIEPGLSKHVVSPDLKGPAVSAIVIVSVQSRRNGHLAKIINAACTFGLFARPCQRWQEQRSKDGDDRNDHQQLDQGKAPAFGAPGSHKNISAAFKKSRPCHGGSGPVGPTIIPIPSTK